ncbi:MAG TPA: hypothetical protein VGE12_08965 [Noviherbaspirillum sp.]
MTTCHDRVRRPAIAAAAIAALLACAPVAIAADEPAAAVSASRPLTGNWQTLSNAMSGAAPVFTPQGFPRAPAPMLVQFLSPVAAAARNGILYVVDLGHRQILRYDMARMAISPFSNHVVSGPSALAVGPDLSLYVTDFASGRVQHFSWDGRRLPELGQESVLRRPVAVVPDDAAGQVYVADSLYNHVVVFSSLGHTITTLRSDESRSIESMARGPDGLYLVDRLSRQVVVLGLDGVDRYAFGSDTLKDPRAIVVDRFNRVFVSDDFDNTIKVFEDGELVASVGGSGTAPGMFNRITHLSLDRNTLYVADSLNARIQFSQLSTPVARRPVPK